MEPMMPKEYEAFFDIRPSKVPVANEASVAMTSGSVKRSKIAYLTFFEMPYFCLLSCWQMNPSLIFLRLIANPRGSE